MRGLTGRSREPLVMRTPQASNKGPPASSCWENWIRMQPEGRCFRRDIHKDANIPLTWSFK
jgi:hypothetical protein